LNGRTSNGELCAGANNVTEEEEDREDAADGDPAKRNGEKKKSIIETKDAETKNEDSDEEIWSEDTSQPLTPTTTMEATNATSLEEAALLKTAWRATNQVARSCRTSWRIGRRKNQAGKRLAEAQRSP